MYNQLLEDLEHVGRGLQKRSDASGILTRPDSNATANTDPAKNGYNLSP